MSVWDIVHLQCTSHPCVAVLQSGFVLLQLDLGKTCSLKAKNKCLNLALKVEFRLL